ncbi:MOSC domain-containing protein [Mobilicoccus pelagius]|uniref:MOSC domain-containing protein n=1 Tax=Mobilicoccus pelagius NBRC 104925 TaxID=1089455 RepID=H5UQB0_9MICO|nr:MOSC domain-containing protein [Mobilicoccus pelagius]GAB47918.1 hypothetical protein MOPEL_031_00210 [Mobilicoccus pelagius NBRC 104925]
MTTETRTVVGRPLVGRPADLPDGRGRSAIAKEPVHGRRRLVTTGFVGDEQADPRHHGGPDKAVHHYAFDHYPHWREWAPDATCLAAPGAFGENVSTTGLTEADVHLGDTFRLGTAVVQVSQGRSPCWKLDVRLGRRSTARHMQEERITGWYHRVLEQGDVAEGDDLVLLDRPEPDWPLTRLHDVMFDRTGGPEAWAAAAALPTLADGWRHTLRARLDHARIEDWNRRFGN